MLLRFPAHDCVALVREEHRYNFINELMKRFFSLSFKGLAEI